jgi:protein tyrosine phosphatase
LCVLFLYLTKRKKKQKYRDWPDGGIPSDRDDYKEFITYLLNLSRTLKEGDGGPVLVHCFGGKGRTGTTIAALLELKKMEQFGGDEIDICGTVSEMRLFRSLLVETLEQYKFIFWVVMALIDSLPKKA